MFLKIENETPRSPVHVVWGAIAILTIVGARIFSGLLPLAPPCIFRTITGIPCLTCGGSHCVVALSHFQALASFQYNPLVMIILVGLIPFSLGYFFAIIFHRRFSLVLSKTEKRIIRIAIVLLVGANWAYLIISLT